MATGVQAFPLLLAAAAVLAPDPAGAWALLPPLPATVALQIYNLLTVEERLRAREVSRAWRNVPGGWRSADLCMKGWKPQRCLRVLELLTKHVAANSIQTLRVEFPYTAWLAEVVSIRNALTAIVNAHSATTRTLDLSVHYYMDLALLDTMLERCPALESFRLDELRCELSGIEDVQQLVPVLKGAGPYSPVTIRALDVDHDHFDAGFEHEALLCEAVQSHRSLRKLSMSCFLTSGAAGALARAAARAGVVDFEFQCDDVDDEAEFTREVAQLLNDFPVQRLSMEFHGNVEYTYDGMFVMALRSHRSLQTLDLLYADFDGENAGVFKALAGHPTLTHLRLYAPRCGQYSCEVLADILAASSALTQLSLVDARLRGVDEDGIRIMIAGLASPDARLQKLALLDDNMMGCSAGFAARVIGPAVLGCASMREVHLSDEVFWFFF